MEGTILPLGRPRCEQRMTRALRRSAYSMVGMVSRMRVSSVMRGEPPSPLDARGTLKSTRMSTRLLVRSRSRMDSFDIGLLLVPMVYWVEPGLYGNDIGLLAENTLRRLVKIQASSYGM